MSYQLQNTHTAKDAVMMVSSASQRLALYAEYADEIVNSSTQETQVIAALKRDGILHIPNFFNRQSILGLGDALVAKIESMLPNMRVRNHREEKLNDFKTMDIKHITLSEQAGWDEVRHHTTGVSLPQPLVNMPQFIEQLITHPRLLNIIMGYYESMPLLTFAKARLAFVNDLGAADTQHWHVDPGSFRVLKALIYLNDVEEQGGPFEYIVGSNVNKFDGWDTQTRYETESLQAYYKDDAFKACTAKAGDILLTDASGFHRGQPPIATDRRIIILNFCLHSEYGLDYERVQARHADVDHLPPLKRALFDDIDWVYDD